MVCCLIKVQNILFWLRITEQEMFGGVVKVTMFLSLLFRRGFLKYIQQFHTNRCCMNVTVANDRHRCGTLVAEFNSIFWIERWLWCIHTPHPPPLCGYRGSQRSNTSSFASNRHDSERIRGLYCIHVHMRPPVCRSLDWDGAHRPPAEGFSEVAVYKASMLDSCWDCDPQGCSMNGSHSWSVCPQSLCLEFKNSFQTEVSVCAYFIYLFIYFFLLWSKVSFEKYETRWGHNIDECVCVRVCVRVRVHSSIMQASGQNKDCD